LAPFSFGSARESKVERRIKKEKEPMPQFVSKWSHIVSYFRETASHYERLGECELKGKESSIRWSTPTNG
jgi:hypothetical protein